MLVEVQYKEYVHLYLKLSLSFFFFTECNRSPDPTDAGKYIEYPGEGHANLTRQCPPGTHFNKDSCNCDIHSGEPGGSNLGGESKFPVRRHSY